MIEIKGEIMSTKFYVSCSDGRVIAATKYLAVEPLKKQFIIINSALGVRQSFYQALALYLSQNGYSVLTWDPRSIGESKTVSARKDAARLRDWGALDLEAILNHVVGESWTNWDNITLLGHSAGGHLTGLCRSINKISNIVFISAGTCGWHLYPVKQWPRMWFAWYLMFPLLIKGIGYIPGKFGIGHDLSKGVALDWRNWSINKDYLFSDTTLTNTYYHQFEGTIHSIGFSDDVGFSPKNTIYDLLSRFPKASKKIRIYNPKELSLNRVGHFGFFKRENKNVWEKVLLNILNKSQIK